MKRGAFVERAPHLKLWQPIYCLDGRRWWAVLGVILKVTLPTIFKARADDGILILHLLFDLRWSNTTVQFGNGAVQLHELVVVKVEQEVLHLDLAFPSQVITDTVYPAQQQPPTASATDF